MKKLKGVIWVETKKEEQWVTSEIPDGECCTPRITKSSKNGDGSYSYFCYRDGRAVAVKKSLDEAKAACTSGELPSKEIDRVMQYAHEHPGEIPPFLALTDDERRAVRKAYPFAAPDPKKVVRAVSRGVSGDAGDNADPGTARLRAQLTADAGNRPAGRVGKAQAGAEEPVGVIRVVAGAAIPKKPGSAAHARWSLLWAHDGKKVAEYKRAKGNMTTLANAMAKKLVTVE